jgi:hypothetical protein
MPPLYCGTTVVATFQIGYYGRWQVESSVNEGMMALRRTWVIFLSVFALLLVYSVAATLLLDRKGYSGDDWAVISFPFWDPIPKAFTEGNSLYRPMQTVWWGIALKVAQFDSQITFFFSLGLSILNSCLLGLVINQAFPNQTLFVVCTIFTSFFFPFNLIITYGIVADSPRVAGIFYLLSVVGFQYHSRKPLLGSLPLLPILSFMLSLLTYESNALMPIFTLFMVLPIYLRFNPQEQWWVRLTRGAELVLCHVIALLGYLYIQGVYHIERPYDGQGAEPFIRLGEYIRGLGYWAVQPMRHIINTPDFAAVLVGLVTVVVLAAFLYRLISSTDTLESSSVTLPNQSLYIVGLGILACLAGWMAFALFNIPLAVHTYYYSNKVYMSAYLGISILLGYGLAQLLAGRWRFIGLGIFAVWCGLMATYHVTLRQGWHQVADEQRSLASNLYDVAPNIADDTTMLFINYDYVSPTYNPIQQSMTVDYYIQMFYLNRTIRAAALLDYNTGFNPTVSEAGLSIPGKLVPLDQVVILARVGVEYRLIERITPDDPYIIQWQDGITELRSNPERILPPSGEPNRFHRIIGLNPTEEVP